jgi:hypothetical protein
VVELPIDMGRRVMMMKKPDSGIEFRNDDGFVV